MIKNKIDMSKQAPASVLAGKYGPGVYLAYEKAELEAAISEAKSEKQE
jgi:hypothetical protein